MMEPDNHIMDLIVRKLNGEISQQEGSELNTWLQASPAHREEYDQYRKLWQEGEDLLAGRQFDTGAAWQKIDRQIRETTPVIPLKKRNSFNLKNLLIAASVVLLAGIAVLYFIKNSNQVSWQEIAATESNKTVTLPDGSVVTLRHGSTLRYPDNFNDKDRQTELKGEAFFDIKRDVNRIFSVQTKQAIVEVLGTSFLVHDADSINEVVVSTGRVRFAQRANKKKEVILEKGQRAILTGEQFERDTVLNTNYRAWENGKLVFNNTPFREAMEDIGDYYNLQIEMAPEVENEVQSVSINAEFENQSLNQVIEEIQLMTGLTITQQDGKLIIQQ